MKKRFKTLPFIISIAFTAVLYSCLTNQVESKYSNFDSAQKEMLFGRGWIPSELVYESMEDIYQRTNVEKNTCIFSFNLSKKDLKLVLKKAESTSIKIDMPTGITRPIWWTKSISGLDQKFLVDQDNIVVYLAIDEKENRIYGWRNQTNYIPLNN